MPAINDAFKGSNRRQVAKDRVSTQSLLSELKDLNIQRDAVESRRREVVDELSALFSAYNIRNLDYDGKLWIRQEGSRPTISGEKVKLAMLNRGIDDEIITDVLKSATTISRFTTIQMREPGKEKRTFETMGGVLDH